MNAELIRVARLIEDMKQECGMDPESATAIRNSRLMSIAAILRGMAAQPADEQQDADSKRLAGYSCANAAQWTNDKTGPGKCARWCGDSSKCISSERAGPLPLPDYEAQPHQHLTKAIRHLLSCYDKGAPDPAIREIADRLIAIRDASA
jgi:hypothetical protein